jgi:hypothetical protein
MEQDRKEKDRRLGDRWVIAKVQRLVKLVEDRDLVDVELGEDWDEGLKTVLKIRRNNATTM